MRKQFNLCVSRAALTLGWAALGAIAMAGTTATAADVTFERLANPEPGNWLINHHDYGSHRYSSLDVINKANVKNLRLAFAVPLGGTSGNEYNEATPIVEDGFLTSLTSGASSTRSTCAPARPDGSSGRWTRAPRRPTATAASRCGATT